MEDDFGTTQLSKLPCIPSDGSIVQDTYLKERDEIQTPEDLTAFVRRWNAIWAVPMPRTTPMSQSEKNLITGDFDPDQIFECLQKNKSGGKCAHRDPKNECESMYILTPLVLLVANLATKRFQIPLDTALLQVIRASQIQN